MVEHEICLLTWTLGHIEHVKNTRMATQVIHFGYFMLSSVVQLYELSYNDPMILHIWFHVTPVQTLAMYRVGQENGPFLEDYNSCI